MKKIPTTFRLSPEHIQALHDIKSREGISLTHQIACAIDLWVKWQAEFRVETRIMKRKAS